MKFTLEGVGRQARTIIERDRDSLSPSHTREYPLVVDHAQGSELWDVDGRRYIDFMSGIAVHSVGHRHPQVEAAVRDQLEKYWHVCLSDFYDPVAVDLAEALKAIAPIDDRTLLYFGNSGAEAVEAAVKLAMYHSGRSRFIAFQGGFHGRTLGALSFTASKSVQRAGYQPSTRVFHLPYPNSYRPVLASHNGEDYGTTVIRYLEDQLFRTTVAPRDVAAILVEPIQGEGGYIVPPPGFFRQLRNLCDRHGILLIVDEIQSGIGRTGRWWAIEHEEVEPDVVCFAKAAGGGLPIGGIITRKELMTWEPGSHGSTFGGNPVAAAAALATLRVIREENLLARATKIGRHIMDALEEMQARHASIGEVRGRGLMIGVEFVHDRETKERATDLRDEIIQRAFRQGLLLLPCGTNTIRLIPALNVPRPLVDEGLNIFAETLAAAEAGRR